MHLQTKFPWVRVFDNTDAGAGTGTGAGDGGAGAGGTGTGGADNEKKFSQNDLNRFLADDRRKHEKRVSDTVSQLEALQKAKGLSDQERGQLQTQIDELKSSLLTKEEQAHKEKERLERTHKETTTKLESDRDMWKLNFTREAISNAIITASSRHKAISAEQVQAILVPNTRITEVLGDDGKPTGQFVPKVKFADKDKDGKAIELDLTIEESVKRMKELPERFGNLFESDSTGGLGGLGGSRRVGATDSTTPPTDPARYREWRKKTGGFQGRK